MTSFQTYVLRVKEHTKTIFRTIWYVHEKALVFVLENMLSNIMRFSCYRHCPWSVSTNWMTMINQNYQAEKLLKQLQNNPIKIMSNSRNSQRAHMLPFILAFAQFGYRSCWCSCTSLHSWKCRSVPERRCPFCRNCLWAFTRIMVATKIRQYGSQFCKADNNKINITSSQGKAIS